VTDGLVIPRVWAARAITQGARSFRCHLRTLGWVGVVALHLGAGSDGHRAIDVARWALRDHPGELGARGRGCGCRVASPSRPSIYVF
jgi:hypothetical protein